MYLRPIFLGIFSFLILTVSRGEMISPLKIPLLMSANFGELRPNHFHSGIDLKTQGRIGLPVYPNANEDRQTIPNSRYIRLYCLVRQGFHLRQIHNR